jgi:probable HAF family extracellular repeat protein
LFLRRTICLLTVLFLVLLAHAARSEPRYSIRGLDPTGTLELGYIRALNNAGQAVGMTYGLPVEDNRALRTDPDGTVQFIPGFTLGSFLQGPNGINDQGQIVGGAFNLPKQRAYLWNPGQPTSRDLGDFVGGNGVSIANGINNDGVVVGTADAPGSVRVAFRWNASTGLQRLGDFGNGPADSSAQAINQRGDIVGSAAIGRYNHAALWPAGGGSIRELDSLPGSIGDTSALALNDLGQAVGYSVNSGAHRAVLWTSDGAVHDLGVLPGTTGSVARGINNLGQIVGVSNPLPTTEFQMHGFLWTAQDGMQDLNDLLDDSGAGWTLVEGQAINQVGQILGLGFHNDDLEAFILTPAVPEPSVASFILGVLFAPWRRAHHRNPSIV